MVDSNSIQVLRLFEFMRLNELEIMRFQDDDCLLIPYLTDLVTACQEVGLAQPGSVNGGWWGRLTIESRKAILESKYRFISSFDTLTYLSLMSYAHKNLRTLRIEYDDLWRNIIPYLSAAHVQTLIEGLPYMQEFEFSPDDTQILCPSLNQISHALAQSRTLKTITCFPTQPRETLLNPTARASMSSRAQTPLWKGADFVWENHYKLRIIRIRSTFVLAS
ncbi:hypothetical protein HYALB_00005894 [Hymenoscyphus albidus]|uniref:Uncharacterized protein n=1 Tax=Hymenoscyphus albidus TaxID=595503 RepID=A0A9N9LPU7_9HELO|nr:hypothetical protein HYALB_00005894 [Hymenoscyphus albidus]